MSGYVLHRNNIHKTISFQVLVGLIQFVLHVLINDIHNINYVIYYLLSRLNLFMTILMAFIFHYTLIM